MAKTTAVSKMPAYAVAYNAPKKVKMAPLYYVAAFLIPALLTFIAYAIFGVYPFGERSVLTLDLNGQYVYYFENIRNCFWNGENPLYSWARNLSGGYQGVIGYYLASPFTFIVILMPRKLLLEALMLMQLCKVGACGVTFAWYAQHSKRVQPLQSVIFSTMYALMAFVAIQLIDPMWVDGPIFLPLIILGVEYLIDDGRKINYIIPLAIMFVANFYIGFMIAIFVAIYFVYYMFFGARRKFKSTGDYAVVFGRMVLATAVTLMCSYIMIMPVYNALSLGKFDFSEPDYGMRTMFNPIELLATLLPNQYYSVNVDEGTRLYGRPEIYCGVLSFVLVPLYFMNKRITKNRKIGHGLLLFVMFFSMWIKPLNMMWHGGQDPNWLPYRYSFIVSFILVAMACESFANLDGYKIDVKKPIGVFAGIAVVAFILDAIMPSLNYNETLYKYVAKFPYTETVTINGKETKHLFLGTLIFGLALAAIYLTFVYLLSHAKNKKQKRNLSLIMACFVIFETGYNTFDTIFKIDKEVYYSSKPSYTTIMDAPNVMEQLKAYDDGFYRAEKTFFRNVNDNQAYGLKGISHSSSVMNARIIRFIETLGYTTKSYETRYDGTTPLADSLLGIKYVLDDPSSHPDNHNEGKYLISQYYNKVFSSEYETEGGMKPLDVYENPDALPIGFACDDDVLRLSFLGNDNPFNSMNHFLSSMTGNTASYEELIPKAYFKRVCENPEVVLNECTVRDYNGQYCYDALPGAGDPTVNIHITPENDEPIYMFLKSDNPKQCNVWISTEQDPETGEFPTGTHKGFGSYYDGYDYSIVNLGSYEAGKEIEIRLTILQTPEKSGANEFIMIKDFQFYNFDYDAFHEDIELLKKNTWDLDLKKTSDAHLVGDIDIDNGQIMYTSIPYEPGWTIKVDGKKMDEQFIVSENDPSIMANLTDGGTGVVCILNAMIGLRLPAGHHTVAMKYSPPGFNTGVFLLILGIAAIVMFYLYDRKNNPAILAMIKAKKEGYPEPAPTAAAAQKKPVQIIKSGSGANKKAPAKKSSPAPKAKPKKEEEEEIDPSTITDGDSVERKKAPKKKLREDVNLEEVTDGDDIYEYEEPDDDEEEEAEVEETEEVSDEEYEAEEDDEAEEDKGSEDEADIKAAPSIKAPKISAPEIKAPDAKPNNSNKPANQANKPKQGGGNNKGKKKKKK